MQVMKNARRADSRTIHWTVPLAKFPIFQLIDKDDWNHLWSGRDGLALEDRLNISVL